MCVCECDVRVQVRTREYPQVTHIGTHTPCIYTSVYLSNLGHQRPFDQSNVICMFVYCSHVRVCECVCTACVGKCVKAT